MPLIFRIIFPFAQLIDLITIFLTSTGAAVVVFVAAASCFGTTFSGTTGLSSLTATKGLSCTNLTLIVGEEKVKFLALR